jgi:hypothetical protein
MAEFRVGGRVHGQHASDPRSGRANVRARASIPFAIPRECNILLENAHRALAPPCTCL